MTAEERHMEELWKEYTEDLNEKRDKMISLIQKMGADELELMWKKFQEFEMDLFLDRGRITE